MTRVQVILFFMAWISTAIALTSNVGAHFAADHGKRNGVVPKNTSDFFEHSLLTVFNGFMPSFSAIYSDVHRQYGSRFITRCIHIARTTYLLAAVFLAAYVVCLMAGI